MYPLAYQSARRCGMSCGHSFRNDRSGAETSNLRAPAGLENTKRWYPVGYHLFVFLLERETGLEPAASTLARSRSTNWATRAKSGWWESNPHIQLGRLVFYHWTTPAGYLIVAVSLRLVYNTSNCFYCQHFLKNFFNFFLKGLLPYFQDCNPSLYYLCQTMYFKPMV